MKKVLFATTALVAFAGAASADVAVSGYAEIGIADTDADLNGASIDTQDAGFYSALDVYFDMTGETDGGIAFGASIDLEDAAETGGNNADTFGNAGADYTVFVSGAFGTLTMGDTDGAMDWALTEGGNVGNPGSINDAETGYTGYAGAYLDGSGDGTVLRYDYSFGDYAFAVSSEQGVDAAGNNDGDSGYAIGFKGTVAGVSFGIAHQNADMAGVDADLTGLSLGYSMNGLSVGAMFASGDVQADADLTGAGVRNEIFDIDRLQLGVGYTTGALSLHANYAENDLSNRLGTLETDGFGFAAAYDLGGGAAVHFGYGAGDATATVFGTPNTVATADDSVWSLGMSMSF